MSSLESKDPWGQLMQLKAITFQTGVMHQAQIDQLRLWGRVAFQYVPRENFACHISSSDRTVSYVLTGGKLYDKSRGADHNFKWLVNVIAGLDRSIHDLLGEEWQLLINFKGKNEYTGQRLSTADAKVAARREYRRAKAKR